MGGKGAADSNPVPLFFVIFVPYCEETEGNEGNEDMFEGLGLSRQGLGLRSMAVRIWLDALCNSR